MKLMQTIPIEVSARHIHLSENDLFSLFGEGYILTKRKDLSQFGQFASEETVDIKNGDKQLLGLRILGPVREKTQVEISLTDSFELGVEISATKSEGDFPKHKEVIISGPKGEIIITEGLMAAWRHIHLNQDEAEELKLKDGDFVSVKVKGDRSLTFNNVYVRVDKTYNLSMHIDTDEANAAGIIKKGEGLARKAMADGEIL